MANTAEHPIIVTIEVRVHLLETDYAGYYTSEKVLSLVQSALRPLEKDNGISFVAVRVTGRA